MLRLTQQIVDNKEDPEFRALFLEEMDSLLNKKGATIVIDPDLEPAKIAGFFKMVGDVVGEASASNAMQEIVKGIQEKLGVDVQVIRLDDFKNQEENLNPDINFN